MNATVRQHGRRQAVHYRSENTIRFGLSAITYSLIPWGLILLGLFALQAINHRTDHMPLRGLIAIGLYGILVTPIVIIVGLRVFVKISSNSRFVKAAFVTLWILASSAVWWAGATFAISVTATGDVSVLERLRHPLFAITSTAIMFCGTYLLRQLRRLGYAQRRRDAIEAQRRMAFCLLPKVQAFSILDATAILEDLDTLANIYESSHVQGSKALRLLMHNVGVRSDPRFNALVSLPIALEMLRSEIAVRKEDGDWSGTIHIAPTGVFEDAFVVEPSLVCALVVFVAEYQRLRTGRVSLDISFRMTSVPMIHIQTNIMVQDLWFILEEQTVAHAAKLNLMAALNETGREAGVFDIVQGPEGAMLFRLSVKQCQTTENAENIWRTIEQKLGPGLRLVSVCSLSRGCNRVYSKERVIYKIQRLDQRSPKPLSLSEEYAILKRLDGVRGIPRAIEYRDHGEFAVLTCSKLMGRPIDQYLTQSGHQRMVWVRCLAELSGLLYDIHDRGVIHRDLKPGNILVTEDGAINLIDFDQAVAGMYHATRVDTRGETFGIVDPCFSMKDLVDSLGLAEEYCLTVDEFRGAWEIGSGSTANSPGQNVAYYQWLFGDFELPGERDWFIRWRVIRESLQELLPGARVLDLGCNLGLLTVYCKLYGAKHVVGLDIDQEIIAAGKILARASGVDVEFYQCDLNSGAAVKSAIDDQRFDLVIACSVLYWLKDRSHALRILRSASTVLYEGHDSLSGTIAMLQDLGFAKITVLGYSERLRAICLATK